MKKLQKIIFIALVGLFINGCAVISENRVFPKLTWYWSKDAKMQREYDKKEKEYQQKK